MFPNVVVVCLFLIIGLLMADKLNTVIGVSLCGVVSFWVTSSYLKKILYGSVTSNHFAGRTSSRSVVLDISRILNFFNAFQQVFMNFGHWFQTTPDVNRGLNDTPSNTLPEVKNGTRQVNDLSLVDKFHCGQSASLNEEIKTSVHHISREYVKSWYGRVSDNQDFIKELDYVLEDILVAICNSLSRVNTKKLTERLLHLYFRHFTHYLQALKNVKQALKKTSIMECIGMQQELESSFKMHHPSLNSEIEEWYYLKSVVGTVLDFFGPVELLKCPVLHNLVVEILAQNMLHPLLTLISDPSWINWALLRLLADERFLHESVQQKYESHTFNTNLKQFAADNESEELSAEYVKENIINVHKPTLFGNDFQLDISRRHSEPVCSCTNDKCTPPSLTFSAHDLDDNEFDLVAVTEDSNTNINDKRSSISGASHFLHSEKNSKFWDRNHLDDEKLGGLLLSLSKLKTHSNICLATSEASENAASSNSANKSEVEIGQQMTRSHSLDFLSQVACLPSFLPFSSISANLKKIKNSDNNLPLHNKKERSGTSTEVDEAEEAVEIDANLFSNITILSTEEQVETGRGSYTLYCIQYDALFTDTSTIDGAFQFVKHTSTVKRRFREFLTLQTRLDGNANLKKHLKGIKGPSKWLATPFSQLDKKNIEDRRIFLEHYLQDLCNRKTVANSVELQEFLAYGGDPSIAYVKKATEITVPRIDKILVKGMKGAIDLLKTALPGLPPDNAASDDRGENSNDKNFVHQKLTLPVFGRSRSETKQLDMGFVYEEVRVSNLMKQINAYLKNFDLNSSVDSVDDQDFSSNQGDLQCGNYFSAGELSPIPSRELFSIDDCIGTESRETENFSIERLQDLIDQEIPLASLVIDIAAESIQNTLHKYKYAHFVLVLKMVCGSALDRWLEKKIEQLVLPHKCTAYLHILHELLWPTNTLSSPVWCSDEESKEIIKNRALSSLITFVSGTLKYIMGPSQLEESMELLLDSLQYPQLNRCLVFHLLDLCMEPICSRQML